MSYEKHEIDDYSENNPEARGKSLVRNDLEIASEILSYLPMA